MWHIRSIQASSGWRSPGGRVARPLRSSSFGQQGPQLLLTAFLLPMETALLVHAEPHRLAEQGVGVLLAGEVEQGPGAPGEHDAVDVDIILDDVLEVVVRLVERPARQRGEGSLGALHVLPPRRLAQGFRPRPARGQGGRLDAHGAPRGSGLPSAGCDWYCGRGLS